MNAPAWLRFDRKDVVKAAAFVLIGICVRLALLPNNVPNFEPVMALTIIASMVMPLALAAVVPFATMAVTDAVIYALNLLGGYGIFTIVSITFFVWTGFLTATLIGWRLRKRYVFRLGNLGIVMAAGVLATLVFDLWTDLGVWWFFHPHTLQGALDVLELQVPFTLAHLASTLIFIPLFGSGYLLLTEHKVEVGARSPQGRPDPE